MRVRLLRLVISGPNCTVDDSQAQQLGLIITIYKSLICKPE